MAIRLSNDMQKEIVFNHLIWQAVSLLNAENLHLCIMIRNGRSSTDPTESESWFWSIYNTDTKEIQWFMNLDKAKAQFLKQCEGLLMKQAQ